MYGNKLQQYLIEFHAALGFCFYFNAMHFKGLDTNRVNAVFIEALIIIAFVFLYRTFKSYYQIKKDDSP